MAFDQAAIKTLYAQVASALESLGAFRSVIKHEPKAAPASLPALALWWAGIGPARGVSGLDATSARIEFGGRIYTDFTKPDDDAEVQLMALASQLIGAFTGRFELGGNVMEVDLLGAYGGPLSVTPGYINHDGREFRVGECVIPVICDGLWVQVP
jgi:hypothetical protein